MNGDTIGIYSGYKGLMIALYQRAVLDYQHALCVGGYGAERTIKEVEMFAKGSSGFDRILYKCRSASKAIQAISEDHGEEIVMWTRQVYKKRRYRKGSLAKAPYKCPFCGSGLYAWGNTNKPIIKIKCGYCSLEGRYFDMSSADYRTRIMGYESEKRRLPQDLTAKEYEREIKRLASKYKI